MTVTVASSSAKAITAFSFASLAATGTINEAAKTIALTVPYGTDVTALVATFTTTGVSMKVGSTVQVSGTTPNNFTNPVSYVVTAADSSTATYTVTVTVALYSAKAQWAKTVTAGSGDSIFNSVSVASDGSSVYAAGEIYGTGTYNFGNGVTSAGTYSVNIVLVKYDSSGVAQWARTVTAGSGNSQFYSVSVTSDGSSVYAVGTISGTGSYDFGNGVTADGVYSGNNIILVKYDSSGMAQWARTVTTGNGSSEFYSVSVGSDGSVYAAGDIYGTSAYDFGNSITAAGAYSGYGTVLVKYNSSGMAQWARTVTQGSTNSSFYSVSVGSDGSAYAAGYISGTGTYGFGISVTAAGTYNGNNNIVLVKYDSSGVAQWAKTVTAGSGLSQFYSVSVGSDGSVYAAGVISGTGTYGFGSGVTATGMNTNYNVILVKYDSSGVTQWAKTVTAGSGSSLFYSISVGSDGSVCAAGVISTGSYGFGNSVTAAGTYSGYGTVLVKYDGTGVAQWAQTVMTGSNSSQFYGVSVGSDGSVYAAGIIVGTGSFNFGNGVTATGTNINKNSVLVKYY